MPAYKTIDKNTGRVKSWYAKFNYRDYLGNIKTKLKRGFNTRAGALEYERDFLDKQAATPKMKFSSLCNLFLEDTRARRRAGTVGLYTSAIKCHFLPVFGAMPISAITPANIRQWQADLLASGLAPSTCHTLNANLTTIFNFAVKFHGLAVNPSSLAGNCGKVVRRNGYWTREQFDAFILTFNKKLDIKYIVLFSLLFWSGARIGEILALTAEDVNATTGEIVINKTYRRINREDVNTPPKTPSSVRRVPLPSFIVVMLCEWIEKTDCPPEGRLFELIKEVGTIHYIMKKHSISAGVPYIKIHGLRHSHASYMVSKGFELIDIQHRLGHESIRTTADIYSHLYDERACDIARRLGE